MLSIQGGVAEELPRSPVEVVRARLADHVDDPAQYSAELRLITVGLNLELLNIVKDWRYRVGSKDLVGIVDPIQQEVVAAIGLPADCGKGERADRGSLCATRVLRHADRTHTR